MKNRDGYIVTIKENENGRNLKFLNNKTGYTNTRERLVEEIDRGLHPLYHVATVKGVRTPKSNPGVKPNLD